MTMVAKKQPVIDTRACLPGTSVCAAAAAIEAAGVPPAPADVEHLRDQVRLEALGAGVADAAPAIAMLAVVEAFLGAEEGGEESGEGGEQAEEGRHSGGVRQSRGVDMVA